MKADVILKKKEDAVSPVIGVMLMLVVTIVIAAVVAAFAGGLGSDVEMAPTAALDIDVKSDGTVKIESLSGEALVTKDISIKVTDASGNSLGTGKLYEQGTYKQLTFIPGTTSIVTLENENVNAGDYVTVTVLANGKHIVAKKNVLVK
ncbi:MAG: type IV pilin [Methanocorpusculum sp.]|nr:type IV pilin [Methanocorpusculum sp.]